MAWVAAVDYRKGIGEAADGKPCRNFGKLEKLDNGIVLGAVADGALGVPQSHIGAKTAVRAAMAGLKSARRDVEAALAESHRELETWTLQAPHNSRARLSLGKIRLDPPELQ